MLSSDLTCQGGGHFTDYCRWRDRSVGVKSTCMAKWKNDFVEQSNTLLKLLTKMLLTQELSYKQFNFLHDNQFSF